MPIIKSAQKRVRSAKKAAVRNSRTRRELRDAVKTLQKALASGKKSVDNELRTAQSALDVAVKKNIIHKNKGARKKAQLAQAAKKAGIKPTKKPAAKKPAAKKAAPKKPPAKKTTKKK